MCSALCLVLSQVTAARIKKLLPDGRCCYSHVTGEKPEVLKGEVASSGPPLVSRDQRGLLRLFTGYLHAVSAPRNPVWFRQTFHFFSSMGGHLVQVPAFRPLK